VGALYLLLYGIGRFVIEFFRNDVRGSVGVLSTSQFISLFFVLGAVAMFVINAKRAEPADMILDKEERKEADRRNQEEEHKFKELKKSGISGKIESVAESEEAGKKDETTTNESEN
jgi:hypothetical protein